MNNQTHQPTDVATAAARAVVLAIAVLMFAAMWHSDVTHINERAVAGQSRRSRFFAREYNSGTFVVSVPSLDESTVVITHRRSHRDRNLTSVVTEVPCRAFYSFDRRSEESTAEKSLPQGITAGMYRVVDSLGNVETVQVTSRMASSFDEPDERSQYVVASTGVTRYFIRVQSPIASRALNRH